MKESFCRRAWIAVAVLALGVRCGTLVGAAERSNVLLVCIDDLRPDLGCYGAKHVRSPNIDRLAESGVLFEQCHVQVAVCNPSRASLMTGLRPDRLGCWTLRYHFRETLPDAVTLPQYLRRHGYTCEGFGKIFHNPWQDPRSWSRPHAWGRGSFTHYTAEQRRFVKSVQAKMPDDSWQKSNLRGPITHAPDIADDEHPDGAMARMAVERMKVLDEAGEPFLLAVGFVLPHLPWCPPKRYWDLYDRDELPLAANPFPPKNAPAVALGTNYELTHYADTIDLPSPLEGKVTEERARRFLHAYCAAISFVDAQVGVLLDGLEKQGLADDTIVVLWSDHGWKLGEHNGWGKMTNFEIDTRVPMIVRDPKATANGRRCGQLVESLDLFPTICERAGVPAPDFVDGRSAARLLDDPNADHTGAAFSQYIRDSLIGNAIRTDDWRYVEWRELKGGAVRHRELYDHRTDDWENENVVGEHPEVADRLSRRLRQVLPVRDVNQTPRVRSAAGGKPTEVDWVNRHPGTVRLTWIRPNGARGVVIDLAENEKRHIKTWVGHLFVAESLDGRYHEAIRIEDDHSTIPLGGDTVVRD